MIANWLLWMDLRFIKSTPFIIYCLLNTHHARNNITQKNYWPLQFTEIAVVAVAFDDLFCFKFDEDSHHKILKFSLIIGWPEKTLINKTFPINFISRNKRKNFLMYWWPLASKLKSRQNMIFTYNQDTNQHQWHDRKQQMPYFLTLHWKWWLKTFEIIFKTRS